MGEANRRRKQGFTVPKLSKEEKAEQEGIRKAFAAMEKALFNTKGIGETLRERIMNDSLVYLEQMDNIQ